MKPNHRCLPLYLTAAALALLLAACGGGGSGGLSNTPAPAMASMEVVPSLGLVRQADVELRDADGVLVASGRLASNGRLLISYPQDLAGPLLVVVRGNALADYFDESAGVFLPFPATEQLRTWLIAPVAEVGVTTLTELAASLIESAGPVTPLSIGLYTELVRGALAADVADITRPPVLVTLGSGAGLLDDTDAGRYGAILAALAQVGSSGAAPALNVLEQLRADILDGQIDGHASGTPIANGVYLGNSFASDLLAQLNSAAQQWGTPALHSRSFAQPQLVVGSDLINSFIGPGGGAAAVVQARGSSFCVRGSEAEVRALISSLGAQFTGAPVVLSATPFALPLIGGVSLNLSLNTAGSLLVNGVAFNQSPFSCAVPV